MNAVETGSDVAPLYLRVMGVVVEVEVPDAGTRERLATQWSRASTERPDDGPDASLAATAARPGTEEFRPTTSSRPR